MCYPHSTEVYFNFLRYVPDGIHWWPIVSPPGLTVGCTWAGGVFYLETNVHPIKLHDVIDFVLVKNVFLFGVCVFGSHVLKNKGIRDICKICILN